jgi:hypothetical protein
MRLIFVVGPVYLGAKGMYKAIVFLFCACGWDLVLFRIFWVGKVCFYVFVFFENKPVDMA